MRRLRIASLGTALMLSLLSVSDLSRTSSGLSTLLKREAFIIADTVVMLFTIQRFGEQGCLRLLERLTRLMLAWLKVFTLAFVLYVVLLVWAFLPGDAGGGCVRAVFRTLGDFGGLLVALAFAATALYAAHTHLIHRRRRHT